MRVRRTGTLFAVLLAGAALAAGALGCGSDEAVPDGPGEEVAEPEKRASKPKAPPNAPPAIEAVWLDPTSPRPGDIVVAKVDASDPDGDAVEVFYRWQLDGETYGGGGSTLVVPETARKGSIVELHAIARDGSAESAAGTASVRIANRAPEVVDVLLEPAQGLTVEADLAASPRAQDPDGDPVELRFRWRVNDRLIAEEGSVLASKYFRRGDGIVLEVVASDGELSSEPLVSPEIRVMNALPRITSAPAGLDDASAFRYRLAVEDPDGDRRFRFKLLEGPTGMTLDWLTGDLAWDPADDESGAHPIVIEVNDSNGGVATQSFEIEVAIEAPAEEPSPASPAVED